MIMIRSFGALLLGVALLGSAEARRIIEAAGYALPPPLLSAPR